MIPAIVNQMMFGRGATAAAACDLYWSDVVLLMGFEGANGATGAPGMTDESPAAHGTGTATNATISTSQFEFGTSSLFRTGVGGLTFPNSADWQLGSGAFTIEMWVRGDSSIGASPFLVSLWGGAGNTSWTFWISGQKLDFNVSTDGSNNITQVTGFATLVVNAWTAVAIDFDGTKYRTYVNGTMDGSSTTLHTFFNSTDTLSIAKINDYGGYIDELRITKGVARYASDSGYTVATARFPRIDCGACPAASAFLARTSGLNATHIGAYNALICGLVSDGVWAKLDVLHIYATQDSTTALLNLVATSYNGTIFHTPTFAADRGFTGPYIDTNFNPATASSPLFVRNSAHISMWAVTDVGAQNFPWMGVTDGTSNTDIFPKWTDNNAYFFANSPSGIPVANATPTGHYLANRSTSSAVQGYKNNNSISSSGANTSEVVANGNIYVGAQNSNGTEKTNNAGQIAMASIGSSLSGTDVTNFYNRLRTYMTTVGVP